MRDRRATFPMMMYLVAFVLSAASVRAELMVTPARIVMEGTQRATQIDLINTGDVETTYRVSVVNRRMTETGAFVPTGNPAPDERFADQMIRFSPKQVVLAPGEGQSVRLMVRRPANMEPGEYRTHLLLQALPRVPPANEQPDETSGFNIQLTPVYGVTIPIIVRYGATSASVIIQDAHVDRVTTPAVVVDLVRSGNRSVYGDITAYHVSPKGGQTVVGIVKGLAVYTPNRLRQMRLPLDLDPKAQGMIRVVFRERGDSRVAVEAETTISLQ